MVSYTSSSGKVRDVKGLEGWERNAAGMWFSPTYGFGLIDVNKALELAANHQPLPPLVQLPWQKTSVTGSTAAIADAGNSPLRLETGPCCYGNPMAPAFRYGGCFELRSPPP